MKPTAKASSRLHPFLLLGAGALGIALLVGLLLWLVTPQASPPDTAAPAAATETEAVADARSEWQAQQQHISQVMQSKDRATLIGNSPTKGTADADVILFKFSDFQCPYCAVAAGNMKEFMGNHEDNVLYVYKNLPLTAIHDQAMPAARAAWAAQQQGKFWLYHDALFIHQDRLGEDLYLEIAQLLDLDLEQFNSDRSSDASLAAIEQDLALAEELGLNSTPTFLMNDFLIPPGAPLEFFEEIRAKFQAYIDGQ